MDSPQSVVSPFKNLTVSAEPEKPKSVIFDRISSDISKFADRKETNLHDPEQFIGVLDVYIHQARDIHNICIYQKQDVYAKLCLTSDPEKAISTQIINGGGKNPVFNESVRLDVRTVETSLKCEIWMLSRIRNYLEDQLLGFALVPLSEVVILKTGKLEKDFSLSSTDLFHSPAGFVQLSLSYTGASPDIMTIPRHPVQESEGSESVPSDFDKIEFPDPKIVNENQMMVSEYFGLPCDSLDSQSTQSLVSSDTENHEVGVQFESFSAKTVESKPIPKADSPPSIDSTNGSSPVTSPATRSHSSGTHEHVSPSNDKKKDAKDEESHSSNGLPSNDAIVKPVITVNIEPEEKVVQQDIVDMYMKSMQQFTESLAKMKLPMDLDTEPTKSGNSSSNHKSPTSKVFYGSRAFF